MQTGSAKGLVRASRARSRPAASGRPRTRGARHRREARRQELEDDRGPALDDAHRRAVPAPLEQGAAPRARRGVDGGGGQHREGDGARRGVANVKWSAIAQQLGGRIGKQCRGWFNHLDPGIDRSGGRSRRTAASSRRRSSSATLVRDRQAAAGAHGKRRQEPLELVGPSGGRTSPRRTPPTARPRPGSRRRASPRRRRAARGRRIRASSSSRPRARRRRRRLRRHAGRRGEGAEPRLLWLVGRRALAERRQAPPSHGALSRGRARRRAPRAERHARAPAAAAITTLSSSSTLGGSASPAGRRRRGPVWRAVHAVEEMIRARATRAAATRRRPRTLTPSAASPRTTCAARCAASRRELRSPCGSLVLPHFEHLCRPRSSRSCASSSSASARRRRAAAASRRRRRRWRRRRRRSGRGDGHVRRARRRPRRPTGRGRPAGP